MNKISLDPLSYARYVIRTAINDGGVTVADTAKIAEITRALDDINTNIDLSGVTVTADAILSEFVAINSMGQKITGNIQTVTVINNGDKIIVPKGYIAKEQQFDITISGGVDASFVTASASDILQGKISIDSSGKRIEGAIPFVSATLSDNVVTVPVGYISKQNTLTIPEAGELSVSGNEVTVPVGYIKSQRTATIPEAVSPVVTDNKVTVYKGYVPEQKTLTVANAATPTTSGNVVTVNKGYQAAEKKITVGTAKPATTIIPGVEDQTVPAGTYLSGILTVKGDANLTAENIREGVSIFGVEGALAGSGNGGRDFYKCASVNSTVKTWNGYKATLSNGVYSFAETPTENLSYGTGFTPNVGKIYNSDATVSVSGLWSGLPADGLAFYAPLSSNTSVAETGQALSTLSGEVTYTTANGIPCAFFDGSSVLAAGTSGLPYSNSPFTMSFFICPTSSPSADTGVFAFGKDSDGSLISVVYSSGVITLASHGGGWGQGSPTPITWDNTMKHIAFVVGQGDTDNRPLSVYLNGVKVTDTYLRMSGFASDFKMYIGSYWGNADYIPNFTGYLSSLRIYDRALAPDEISTLASEFTITA